MNRKRILSLILAISMIMTSFAAVVYADETAEEAATTAQEPTDIEILLDEDTPYYRAAVVLSALGIMKGKSATDFAADDFLTRAEMSTIAIRFIGLDGASKTGVADSGYTDVGDDHWAKYYIDTATALDILHGYGDGTFGPDGELTAEQTMKILVCAMGYEPKAETIGNFPVSYMTIASNLGLLKGVTFEDGTDAPIERWKVAMMVYNALEADLMDVIVYGANNYSIVTEDSNALGVYHNIVRASGTVTATYESAFDDDYRVAGDITIDGIDYVTDLDTSRYLGQYVDFYYIVPDGSEKGEIVAIFVAEKTEETVIDFDDLGTVSVSDNLDVSIEYYPEDGGRLRRISLIEPRIMYNGKLEEFADAAAAQAYLDANMNQGQLRILKNSMENAGDVLFVENYDAYVVQSADSKNMIITYNIYEVGKTNTATLDLSVDDNPERKVFVYGENGEEITLDDLAANDVISIYASTDKLLYRIYQSKKQVTGIINRRDEIPGTSTPPPEKLPTYWETMTAMNMDSYVTTSPTNDYDVTTGYNATGMIDNRTSYLYVNSGEYDGKKGLYTVLESDKNVKRLYHMMGFRDATGTDYSWPTDFPGEAGTRVFELSREETSTWTLWNPWSPYYGKLATWVGAGWGAPDSYMILTNLFDESKVIAGDKLRITAWVMGRKIYDTPTERPSTAYVSPTESAETTAQVQMWISESKSTDGDWQWGEDKDYSLVEPDPEKPQEVVTATINEDEWTKVVLEYELTPNNIGISSIQINTDNATHDITHYPLQLAIAGVTVERFVDPNVATGRPEVRLDTTDYDIYLDGVEYKPVSNFPTSLLELGREVTLLLDSNGKIAGFIRSLATEGFGLLMDVGVVGGAFGSTLQVKIFGNEKITTYETTEEIKAFNGTDVVKMPAEQLVTYEPEDPKTGWHLWSYDNADNFEAVPRTWVTDDERSKAASRKVVYYETNSKGQIHTILVPSMPEDHPDAKIVMIKDFEYGNDTLYHSQWPKWLTHASVVGRTEPIYRMNDNLVKWFILPNGFTESDYMYGGNGQAGMWEDNVFNGRAWYQAQLYRVPGSKTVDFMVMNGNKMCTESSNCSEVVVVDRIEETEDGYTLYGWKANQQAASSSNHTYTAKIKEGTRVFENIWMSAPNADGVRLTWDNIGEYANTLPYNCSYEALGQETPYVEPGVVESGDVVRVKNYNGEIEYFEVIRRKSVALCSQYSLIGRGSISSFNSKDNAFMNGEVTEINIEEGYVKVKGFYWPSPSDVISASAYTQSTNSTNNYVTEIETIFRPTPYMVIYDEEKEHYISAIFEDINIGDMIFTVGTLSYPPIGIIYKNHNK